MHFRSRGRMIQVIRTVYDKQLKRGRTQIVGRLERHAMAVGDDLRRECTPAEIAEIEAWIANRSRLEGLREEYAARTLPDQIALAAGWFQRASADEARGVAADLLPEWTRLRVTLKKLNLMNL